MIARLFIVLGIIHSEVIFSKGDLEVNCFNVLHKFGTSMSSAFHVVCNVTAPR